MRRINNIFERICDINNIELADKNARRGKHNCGIVRHDQHRQEDNEKLKKSLEDGTYVTSEYVKFKIYEPKERIIYKLPYYPDRIAQWSIMLQMEPIWLKIFINNTYSCIGGRGIHKLAKDLKNTLQKDRVGTTYCLKLDIKKFYPSIDHEILKQIIRKKIKDMRLLNLLDGIIDSTNGIPIGNYLSQFFANLYLSYFDHWLYEEVKVKYYFRYADDIVILSDNKEFLHKVLILIKLYLEQILKLQLKPNYQVFPVESRGIDFVGYKFFHDYTLLRKSIKKKMFRSINLFKQYKITKETLSATLVSYFGWLKYCDSKHLLYKIEQDTGLHYSNWHGTESCISKFYDKNIQIIEVVYYKKYFKIHFVYCNKSYSVNSSNKRLSYYLRQCVFPINLKLERL